MNLTGLRSDASLVGPVTTLQKMIPDGDIPFHAYWFGIMRFGSNPPKPSVELSSNRSKLSIEPEMELFCVAKSPTAGRSSHEKVLMEGASYIACSACALLADVGPAACEADGSVMSAPSAMLPRPGGFLHNKRMRREYLARRDKPVSRLDLRIGSVGVRTGHRHRSCKRLLSATCRWCL